MAEQDIEAIRKLLERCSPQERQALFRELRAIHQIHELEDTLGAPAEVILEAIHRAPELTRRMLRGVIADAAFAQSVVPALADRGWKNVTPAGNHSFDYVLRNAVGAVSGRLDCNGVRRVNRLSRPGRATVSEQGFMWSNRNVPDLEKVKVKKVRRLRHARIGTASLTSSLCHSSRQQVAGILSYTQLGTGFFQEEGHMRSQHTSQLQ